MYNLAIVPTNRDFFENRLFNVEVARDRILEPWAQFRQELQKNNIRCNTLDLCNAEDVDAAIVFRLDIQMNTVMTLLRRNPACRIFLFAFEPPPICGLHESNILPLLDVDRIFTWRDDIVDHRKVLKVNEPRTNLLADGAHFIPYSKRRMLVTITGNKDSSHPKSLYKKRRYLMKTLSAAGIELDLYGMGWDASRDPAIKSLWKGTIGDKLPIQSQYKFTLCLENAFDYPGFVSEKIFDAFSSGSIPIYYGASNIEKIVPDDCFIDFRKFQNIDELVAFLRGITEKQYEQYIANITNYMNNNFSQSFSGLSLARVLMTELENLSTSSLPKRSAHKFLFTTLRTCLKGAYTAPRIQKLKCIYRILRSVTRV
jgi:hypothetical protein